METSLHGAVGSGLRAVQCRCGPSAFRGVSARTFDSLSGGAGGCAASAGCGRRGRIVPPESRRRGVFRIPDQLPAVGSEPGSAAGTDDSVVPGGSGGSGPGGPVAGGGADGARHRGKQSDLVLVQPALVLAAAGGMDAPEPVFHSGGPVRIRPGVRDGLEDRADVQP